MELLSGSRSILSFSQQELPLVWGLLQHSVLVSMVGHVATYITTAFLYVLPSTGWISEYPTWPISSTDCVYSVSHSGTDYGASVTPEKDWFTAATEMRIVSNCRVFLMFRIVYVSGLSPIDSDRSMKAVFSLRCISSTSWLFLLIVLH
jgi:hypothetical protein